MSNSCRLDHTAPICRTSPVPPPDFKGTLADWTALKPSIRYSMSNRVKIAASNKLWRQQNYTKIEAKKKLWRQQNKEKVAAFKKQWKQQNAAKVAGYQHKRYIKRERTFYAMFGSQGII